MAAISTIIAGAGLAIGGYSSYKQSQQAAGAADAQKEARSISRASETIRTRAARQRAAREERIRRAQIAARAGATGTAGSSGFGGATSALSSNYGSQYALQQSQLLGSAGISKANQTASNFETSYQKWGQFSDFTNSVARFTQTLDLGNINDFKGG